MTPRRWRLAPAGVILALGSAVMALGWWSPERYKLLLQEDGPAEWLTVLCFACAAVLIGREALRSSQPRLQRAALVGIALFCVFVAGEEISWGQRLINFQPPELFLESNYQQESNLHNLLKDIFDSRWQVFIVALGYGLLAPLLAWRRLLPRWLAPDAAIMPGAAAVALLELSYPLELTGELAELLLGACFLHDAALRRTGGKGGEGGRLALLALGGCGVAAWCMPPLIDATLCRPDPELVRLAHAELATLRSHLEGGAAKERLFAARRVHKRLFTAVKAGYLTAPSPHQRSAGDENEQRRSRYLLDPWQQPYWMMFEPRTADQGVALLYSFGPNRRRDTLLERLPAGRRFVPSGDDLAIMLRVRR